MTADLSLRFPKADLPEWARRYSYADDKQVLEAGERARSAGYFTRDDFLKVCDWKTGRRPRRHYILNSEHEVRRITTAVLLSTDEPKRLWSLVAPNLKGVQMPTASVLLHLAVGDPTSPALASTA